MTNSRSRIRNLAELIAGGYKPVPKDTLMSLASQMPKANAVEPTEQGKKELGKLAMASKEALQLENPWVAKRRQKRTTSDRPLPSRPISYKAWSEVILRSSLVDISDDTLHKLCEGGDIDLATLFKVDAAGFIKHPSEPRAITSTEIFALLRSEITVEDMKAQSSPGRLTRRRSQSRSA